MRSVRRWLFVAALAVAGVWFYAIAGSGAKLLTLFDGLDAATALARVDVQQMPVEPDAANEGPAQVASPAPLPLAAPVAEAAGGFLPHQMSTDELSAAEIMRLLEDEIVSDTDPAATDEFLREFGESLDTQD